MSTPGDPREFVVHLTRSIGRLLSAGLEQTAENAMAARAKANAADADG